MRPLRVGGSCVRCGMGMRMTKPMATIKPATIGSGKSETKINLKVQTPKKYVSFT